MNNKRKKYVKIDRETGSDEIFAMLDEANSDLDDFDNLMNDSTTEFVLTESLENELDSNDKPLNLLVPEANYVVENPTIKKALEEGSRKAEKEVKGKPKKTGKGKGIYNGKSKGKSKEKEIRPGEIEFGWGKNMLQMQRNNVVRKLTLSIIFHNTTSLLMYFLL